jgi:threonine/homoserine/homoserine lactone efflux protein
MSAAGIVLGVFAGSALWWLLLTSGVALARRRLTSRLLRAINILSGLALLGFGLLALASLLPPLVSQAAGREIGGGPTRPVTSER